MATYNTDKYKSYDEFFAFERTHAKNMDDIRDSDDCSRAVDRFNKSQKKKESDELFKRYWSNGNLRYQWKYKKGRQEGVSLAWYPNGNLKNIQKYINGQKDGFLMGFWENTNISGVRFFSNGTKVGTWVDFWPNGQRWCEKIFDDGQLVSEKYWKEDGSKGNRDCHHHGEIKYFRKINPKFK